MINKVETTFLKTVTLTLCGLIGYLLFPMITFAHVGYEIDLRGWAWSSTVGWISMSCENTGTCDTVSYRVVINEGGDLVGYAWSAHIGWIQFGGLSGFPAAGGNASVTEGGELRGWARAVSGANEDDGWDGWISLSCTNNNQCATSDYGPYVSNLTQPINLSGFAWGSTVVGWVDFSGVTTDPPADLIVASATLNFDGFDPTEVVYEEINIDMRLQNIGGKATPDDVPIEWEARLLRVGQVEAEVDGVYNSPLAAGASTDVLSFTFSDQEIGLGEGYEVIITVNPGFQDAILESDYDNNSVTVTRDVLPPDPGLSLSLLTNVVRQNTSAELEWGIDIVYNMDCIIRGPGVNTDALLGENPNRLEFNPAAADAPDHIITTTPRPSASVYDFTCTVDNPDGGVWEVGNVGPERLEVVSTPREI